MKESGSRCPYCGKEYPKITIPRLFGEGGRAIYTTHCGCDGEMEAEHAEYVKARQRELAEAWHKTGAPKMFWDVAPDYDSLEKINEGKWLYLYGPRGTGKTYRGCRILKAYVARAQKNGYASARFIDLTDWFASMRRDWGSQEEDAYQRAAGVRLLLLDDLGKGKPTEWAMERLFRLVKDRHKDLKPTIITSQYNLDMLAKRCSVNGDYETVDAMVSRIYQRSESMKFDGPDLRVSSH